MNAEDSEAENTQDEIDGACDGVSGKELASVRSLAWGGVGGGGRGWRRGQKEKSVVYLDKLISLFWQLVFQYRSAFFFSLPSYFLRHIRNFRAHTSVCCLLLKELLHMVHSVCKASTPDQVWLDLILGRTSAIILKGWVVRISSFVYWTVLASENVVRPVMTKNYLFSVRCLKGFSASRMN
jgi:hypothetical protein